MLWMECGRRGVRVGRRWFRTGLGVGELGIERWMMVRLMMWLMWLVWLRRRERAWRERCGGCCGQRGRLCWGGGRGERKQRRGRVGVPVRIRGPVCGQCLSGGQWETSWMQPGPVPGPLFHASGLSFVCGCVGGWVWWVVGVVGGCVAVVGGCGDE